VLLDGDVGLRCADLLLGMQDRVIYDLGDLAEKNCPLEQAMVRHPSLPSLSLVAAPQMISASDLKRKAMGRVITELSDNADVLIIDAPAGIGRSLKNLLGAAAEPVIVATPDDVCLRDAERLSLLLTQREEPRPVVVFNRVSKKLVRLGEMRTPAQLAATLDMPLMGAIPDSPKVYRALLRRQGALHCGDPEVVSAIEHIAARLMGKDVPQERYKPSAFLRFFSKGGEA
jgi:septum site-determining protein MinD